MLNDGLERAFFIFRFDDYLVFLVILQPFINVAYKCFHFTDELPYDLFGDEDFFAFFSLAISMNNVMASHNCAKNCPNVLRKLNTQGLSVHWPDSFEMMPNNIC